jgi:CheY-like chemotaxis protein
MAHIYVDTSVGRPIGELRTVVDNTSSGLAGGNMNIGSDSLPAGAGAVTLVAEEQPHCTLSRRARGINDLHRSALVVENNRSLSATFATLMKHEGYAVRTACDCEEGIRLYMHCAPFSAVIVDYSLPGNGFDLVKAIRQENHSQRILIAAFHYRHEGEVPRPHELKDIPLLIDITHLRRILKKLQFWATRDEIEEAIEKLTPAQLLRLRLFADRMAQRLGTAARGRDGSDLLQEALLLTFEGAEGTNGRHWKKGVDFCRHLEWAVKSKADNWKHKRTLELQAYEACEMISPDSEEGRFSPINHVASRDAAADQCLIAREQVERILRVFEHDEAATIVLRGWSEGVTACEMIMEYGLTKQQYEAAVKRIRTKLQKRGGEGHGA